MNQNQRDTLTSCLTQVFGRVDDHLVDAAIPLLTWHELRGGETVLRQGDPASGVYFVISGRLEATMVLDGAPRSLGQIGRGETVGEVSELTGEPQPATVTAIRDTLVVHATQEAFEQLWRHDPQLPIHMTRIVIRRLHRASQRPKVSRPETICLLPITDGVDLHGLGQALVGAMDRWGVATLETSATMDARFGTGAATTVDPESDLFHRVTTWLDDVEFWNDFVVLMADPTDTEWTRRCLRQADEVMLVARADAPTQLHPLESLCHGEGSVTGARQVLVLLHDDATPHPTGTPRWLDRRPVDGHFHIRPGLDRDIQRLARIVSRNAVGLVLAGGGARGFAHLGVFKALDEAGIEIDYVGGTSVGASMAAWVALDLPVEEVIERARYAYRGNPTGDVNPIPLLSLIRGRRIRRRYKEAVTECLGREGDVSDSWKTLYCVASSFSEAAEKVIRRGRLDRALRASAAIPVALPPVTWEGELLVDGGVFNNFPTDVMAALGARRIIGVDLARRSTRRYDFDEVPGTLELLRDRFRPRKRRRYRLPGLGVIMLGTTVLYSESRRAQARESTDLYINPDLAGVGLMDWKGFDRVLELGYQHTKELLAAMPESELAAYRNLPAQDVEMAADSATDLAAEAELDAASAGAPAEAPAAVRA
jgi:NTE family protein